MATVFGFEDHAAACEGGLEAFAQRHPEFEVTEVKNATMASDESKNKLLDTAKATRKNAKPLPKTAVNHRPQHGLPLLMRACACVRQS